MYLSIITQLNPLFIHTKMESTQYGLKRFGYRIDIVHLKSAPDQKLDLLTIDVRKGIESKWRYTLSHGNFFSSSNMSASNICDAICRYDQYIIDITCTDSLTIKVYDDKMSCYIPICLPSVPFETVDKLEILAKKQHKMKQDIDCYRQDVLDLRYELKLSNDRISTYKWICGICAMLFICMLCLSLCVSHSLQADVNKLSSNIKIISEDFHVSHVDKNKLWFNMAHVLKYHEKKFEEKIKELFDAVEHLKSQIASIGSIFGTIEHLKVQTASINPIFCISIVASVLIGQLFR